MKVFATILLTVLLLSKGAAMGFAIEDTIEILDLDVISYEAFVDEDSTALDVLKKALHEKGIVGIKGIPGFKEKVLDFIRAARDFSSLPEEIKEVYGRPEGEIFLGYEKGKERFQRLDGKWVVDDLKVSYYGLIPDTKLNKWPCEINLRAPFLSLGELMTEMGEAVMNKIELLGDKTGIFFEEVDKGIGRMLYYRKSSESAQDNPYWCGAHFDHGLFTALLPAFYFVNGEAVPEPAEAGLFVKPSEGSAFKKVVADDPDVLLFQVGEFGQLATHDAIQATQHCVRKALGQVERYTFVLFLNTPMHTVIRSFSQLTQDARYQGQKGDPCTYRTWHEGSFNRYLVKEDNKD
jgi:isopenicillin N synthase-like dioxygenase